MPRSSRTPAVLRGVAITIFVLSLGLIVFAMSGGDSADSSTRLLIVLAALMPSIGIAAGLWALASGVFSRASEVAGEHSKALVRIQAQLNELTARVMQLDDAAGRIARAQENVFTQPPALTLGPSDLEPLYQAIREVRDLSLLPDSDRKDRLHRHRSEKKSSEIKRAFDLVAAQKWHDAEKLVLSLETEFPNDPDVAKGRSYLNNARKLHEDEAVTQTLAEVEELMTGSGFDEAISKTRRLIEDFPDNGPARSLFIRVQRERDLFHESTVGRMFDELRNDIERRYWRRALLHAQMLLQKFPAHPRADGVRRQFQTIQDNAEIEERQELEVRIQELIRAQKFDEAIDLGEDLIRRYPLSPQAESLDVLLPRLRQLSVGGIDDFSGLGSTAEEAAPRTVDDQIIFPQQTT